VIVGFASPCRYPINYSCRGLLNHLLSRLFHRQAPSFNLSFQHAKTFSVRARIDTNIKRNMALLTSLDIHTDLFPPRRCADRKSLPHLKKGSPRTMIHQGIRRLNSPALILQTSHYLGRVAAHVTLAKRSIIRGNKYVVFPTQSRAAAKN